MAFVEAAAENLSRTGGNNPDVMYEAAFTAAPQPPSADAAAAPADERAAFEQLKNWPKMAPREVFYAGWRAARAADAQAVEAVAIPAGWKLVPIAATEAMLNAGWDALGWSESGESDGRHPRDVFEAMVHAAPPSPAPASAPVGLTSEQLRKALSQAWNLGQTYWQQADSEYVSQNRKSDGTRDKYLALVEETCALLKGDKQ
ncbi:hypothetical protein [Burkholderia pseudomallei]|nr:hypothetical protein [Burkholderia pseudomallei]